MKLFPITLAICLAMASTSALASKHAAPPAEAAKPVPGMGMGMGMDCGMMGMDKMSTEQHQKKMDAMFTHMDANADGSVTKAEFDAHHKAMMASRHGMMGAKDKQIQPATAPEAKSEAEHKH